MEQPSRIVLDRSEAFDLAELLHEAGTAAEQAGQYALLVEIERFVELLEDRLYG